MRYFMGGGGGKTLPSRDNALNGAVTLFTGIFYGVCRQATNFILQNTIFLFITTKFNLLKNLFRGHFYIVSIPATKVLKFATNVS
ncbi:MAG: hypothetical protein LBR28_02565, partial [Bacteroidales bacterium]|nr:hypothetical protein [Bacteroidales bacterium]